MKFSWEWISEHIKLDISGPEAADLLSLHGLTVDEIIEVDGDYVFDVDITTNRPDAMNIRGIARELSAITGVGLEMLTLNYHETVKRVQDFASINIENAELCHRFCARVIRNAKNEAVPDWMKRRLERVGMRSINLNVDITNYVLWELGHPLHAYDLDTIPGGKIIVRTANKGERLKLIDGTERILKTDDLVISDSERAIGLAGVMGGEETEISANTSNILLECAWFDPVSVRKTSKRHDLKTEASYRFERGMGHDHIPQVIDRTCHLYQKLAGAEITREMIDEYPTEPPKVVLTMNQDRLVKFAGMEISREKVGKIFSGFDFEAEFRETFWKVTVPSRRVDITREADLFEEVIRIVGYDKFPATIPHLDIEADRSDPVEELMENCHGAMLSAGFNEVINYDFINFDDNAVFAPEGCGKPFEISNPIAAPQWTTMRQSLAPSFITTIRHNANLGNTDQRLYEIASVFHRENDSPVEYETLGIALESSEPRRQWPGREEAPDFFDMKGVIETLFTRVGLSGIMYNTGSKAFLAPWASADVLIQRKGETGEPSPIGWFGRLSDDLQRKFDLPNPVYLAQIRLDKVLEAGGGPRTYSRFSRYPEATRDMSILVPRKGAESVTYARIVEALRNLEIEELVDISLIDMYSGKETGDDVSMTVRLVYQSMERTLTVEEVEEKHARARKALEDLGVRFR